MNQQPSVRQMVSYWSHGSPNGDHPSLADRAAIITQVHPQEVDGPALVDLFVMNPAGLFFNQRVPYSETPKAGCWSWPPFVAPPK